MIVSHVLVGFVHPPEYQTCSSTDGENPSCADRINLFNPLDHGTYMGIDVLEGIPHGCLWVDP